MKTSFYALLSLVLLQSFSAISQQGKWAVLKTKNETPSRSECGFTEVNGKLYLIGGDGGSPQAVESFDPKTLTWNKMAQAPVVMHHFQAVSYANSVYVLDAFSGGGFPDQTPMANVYSFDTQKNIWEKGGEIPAGRRRAGAGAVAYNGKLYLVAGIQHGHSSGTTNMFDEYDPQTKTWKELPDAPHIRDHCFAAVVKNKLYVVGGRNTSFRDPDNKISFFSQTMLDVDCYDFTTGTWSTLSAKLPLGSGGGAVVNFNDKLYYMGGERATLTEQNAPRKNTYYLNPESSDNWIETDSLRYGRNGMAATVWSNKIYATGGSGGPGGPPPPGGFGGPGMSPPGSNPNGNSVNSSMHNQMPPPPPNDNSQRHDKATIEVFSLQ